MNLRTIGTSRYLLIGSGFVAGTVIAAIDNLAFGGEVSPLVIVALLLVATAAAGIGWGWRGWPAAVSAWVCVPLVHLVKHILGLPDTLNPNTYASILLLAVFTFVVSSLGFAAGVLFHRLTKAAAKIDV